MLGHDAHSALDLSARRNQRGWQVLAHLHERALSSVHYDVTAANVARLVHLDRADASMPLATRMAVVVHGESAVG